MFCLTVDIPFLWIQVWSILYQNTSRIQGASTFGLIQSGVFQGEGAVKEFVWIRYVHLIQLTYCNNIFLDKAVCKLLQLQMKLFLSVFAAP